MIFKSILFLSFIGLLTTPLAFASSDKGGDVNKKDSQGRKQGLWIYYGKDRPSLGFPSNGKIEEGAYKDDRKEGVWIIYHNDGVTPKLKGKYYNNRPSGQFTKRYSNGKIREVGTFERNKYKDSLKRYHKNGVVEYEANYDASGKEQGQVSYRYPNGQFKFVYDAQNGVPTGKAARYYENGDLKEIIYYAADGSVEQSEVKAIVNPIVVVVEVPVYRESAPKVVNPRTKGGKFESNGYNKVYNVDDEIWKDGDFKNARLWNGKVYEYDSDGILLKVKVFKKGIYHSDGQL
jgi:antitoxin component YwqK of YwqJK toxin-antitoxin module